MTNIATQTPPCPPWCQEHDDGGEGSYFHRNTILTADNVQGLGGDAPITVTVTVEQFENADGDREAAHAYITYDPSQSTLNALALTSTEQARLLGEALIDAADKFQHLA